MLSEAMPAMSLWDLVLGRSIPLRIYEDNMATIKVVNKGYSPKLRHILRTHKVNLSSIKEAVDNDNIELRYVETEQQAADVFTKALCPMKWPAAMEMLGVKPNSRTEDLIAKGGG